jgi:hypothetical protein
MALRFSSGLLTGIQQYGQGAGIPADPRQRDAMQTAGVTNPLLQQFGRGLGGMLGTEMRSPAAVQQAQQEALQEQARQVYSEAMTADPQKQMELASQLMNIQGYEKDALALAQQAQTRLAQQQQQAQTQQFRESLADRATRVGLEGIAQSVALAPSSELPEIAKQIREFEKTQVLARGGKPARRSLARQAGFTDAQIEQIIDAPEEEFKALIEGSEAEAKPYLTTSNEPAIIKTNKFGRVWDETTGTYKNPSELGLRPAPQIQEVISKGDQLTSELSKAGVKKFSELTEAATTAVQTMTINNRSLQILDAGIFSGTGAELLTGVSKVASALGLENAATETASRSEEYVATRAREVGNFIQNFGAGTGLSDADREYAEKAVAGKINMTEEGIRRLLEIERKVSNALIEDHKRVYDAMAKQGADPATLSVFSLPSVQTFEPRTQPVAPRLNQNALRYIPQATGQ